MALFILPFIFAITANADYSNPFGNKFGGKMVVLEEGEIIESDYFAAGDTVEINGVVEGDVFVAGGTVHVRGTISGDLLAVGGSVSVSGNVTQDVRVVGGSIHVSGEIGRNLTVAGGNVDVSESANIGGSISGAAGTVSISSPVGGDINMATSTLIISNSVSGNVEVGGEQVRLARNANVGGDLVYFSHEEIIIADTATVSGIIIRNEPSGFSRGLDESAMSRLRDIAKAAGNTAKIVSLISTAVVGLLLIRLFPEYAEGVTRQLSEQPWYNLVVGFVALFAVPTFAMLLFLTFVGIPIAVMTLALYAIFVYVSRVYVMLWGGKYISKRFGGGQGVYGAFLIGLFAYGLLTLIPTVAVITKILTLLFGFGAMIVVCKNQYASSTPSK